MSFSQIFKKVLIPCAAGIVNADGHTFGPNCAKKIEQGTKPSELPIYSKQCSICGEVEKTPPPPPSGIEEAVGNIRKELWVWQDSLKGYRHKIVDVYRNGFSKADCPEKKAAEARNHLDRSLEEKCVQPRGPSQCSPKAEGTRWPAMRKLYFDRCGRPCGWNFSQEKRAQLDQACRKEAKPSPTECPPCRCCGHPKCTPEK